MIVLSDKILLEDTKKIVLPSGIECEIQELTADAERILTNKADIKSGQWINKFIAKALVKINNKPVPSNQGELVNMLLDMRTGDRNYLLLQIRMQSYGDEMVFNYECPKCHKTSGYNFSLQELLDTQELKIYPYREDTPISIETREGVAEVDYLTGRKEQWLATVKEIDPIYLAMAACVSFNGKAPEYKDFLKLKTRDISKIRAAFSELKGGLDPQIELNCDECDNSYKVMLYQIPDFFMPTTTLASIGL